MIRLVIAKIKSMVALPLFKISWIKKNRHNHTISSNVFDDNKVTVGNHTYGKLNVHMFGSDVEGLEIGHMCSIGGDVVFLLGGNHSYHNISTFPIKNKIFGNEVEAVSKGKIIIKSDVWIGERTIVLSGVTIGQGAVVGAGSVVSKDIPPYAIYVGDRIIKYRFAEELIERLLQLDFGQFTQTFLKEHIDCFYGPVNKEVLDSLINYLEAGSR